MKFKEIKQGEWEELSKYVDTVLVPILPLKTLHQLADLNYLGKIEQAAELIEENLKGRLLLWPTLTALDQDESSLLAISQEFKAKGLQHVFFLGNITQTSDEINVISFDLDDQDVDFAKLSQEVIKKWSQ